MQCELKTLLSKIKKVSPEHIFLGNGSDEAIDLVFRAFCEPGRDNVVAIDPTYGMYQVCAEINDVEYRKVLLDEDFQFSADKLLAAADEHTKLIFLCSPNNPTGNDLLRSGCFTWRSKTYRYRNREAGSIHGSILYHPRIRRAGDIG